MAIHLHRRAISHVARAYSRDPLERVATIGGVNSDRTRWSLSQPAAVALIESGTNEFFFREGEQNIRLVVLTRGGEKYLQSEREKTHPDDLLSLVVPVSTPAPRVVAVMAEPARRRR